MLHDQILASEPDYPPAHCALAAPAFRANGSMDGETSEETADDPVAQGRC
jgi:hypothetical protein